MFFSNKVRLQLTAWSNRTSLTMPLGLKLYMYTRVGLLTVFTVFQMPVYSVVCLHIHVKFIN